MKKILLALILILLFLLALPTDFASALPLAADADTDCYIYSRTSEATGSRYEGFCVVTAAKLGNLAEALGLCRDVLGVSARLEGDGEATVGELAKTLALRIVRVERLDGLTVIYAFSPMLADFVRLFGTRVNVQIAVSGDTVRVGSPLILGGY